MLAKFLFYLPYLIKMSLFNGTNCLGSTVDNTIKIGIFANILQKTSQISIATYLIETKLVWVFKPVSLAIFLPSSEPTPPNHINLQYIDTKEYK